MVTYPEKEHDRNRNFPRVNISVTIVTARLKINCHVCYIELSSLEFAGRLVKSLVTHSTIHSTTS